MYIQVLQMHVNVRKCTHACTHVRWLAAGPLVGVTGSHPVFKIKYDDVGGRGG